MISHRWLAVTIHTMCQALTHAHTHTTGDVLFPRREPFFCRAASMRHKSGNQGTWQASVQNAPTSARLHTRAQKAARGCASTAAGLPTERQGSYGVHGCNAPEDGCARSRGLSVHRDFPGSMVSGDAVAPAVGTASSGVRGRPAGALALSHPVWDPVSPVMAEAGSLGSSRGPACASGTFAGTARLVGAR